MAKQAGPFFFTGTLGDVIFYKSGEQYLVRMKGSYNTKALQKPGARPLMQLRQQEFGQASKLASRVRRQLPLVKRKEVTIGSLTRQARILLRAGKSHEDIIATLLIVCKGETVPPKPAGETSRVIDTSVVKSVIPNSDIKEQRRHHSQAQPMGAMLINGHLYIPLQDYQILTKPSAGYGEASLE